jgi:hypothetical protein
MAFIIKRDGQGIPVSSVIIGVYIAFADYPREGEGYALYNKITNSYFNSFDNDDNEYTLIWNSSTNRWLLSGRGVVATNLTSDSTTIPTSGWIYTTGSGQPIAIRPYLATISNDVGPLPARSIIIKKNTTFKIPRTPEPITTSRAFNSSGVQVGSTNTGNIPNSWVEGEDTITSVIFANDNSVTSIGNLAFYGCTGLTTLTIPNSVTSIGNYAFYGCTGLTTLTIPNSVTSIGDKAFRYNSSLATVTIGNDLTSIGSYAFASTALTNITIPNSVTSIGDNAFGFNTNLTTITIETGVTGIGSEAFRSNFSLATVLCYVAQSAFVGSDAFYNTSSPLTIRARSTDASWTAGTGLTFQGNTNVTVIKNL